MSNTNSAGAKKEFPENDNVPCLVMREPSLFEKTTSSDTDSEATSYMCHQKSSFVEPGEIFSLGVKKGDDSEVHANFKAVCSYKLLFRDPCKSLGWVMFLCPRTEIEFAASCENDQLSLQCIMSPLNMCDFPEKPTHS